MTFTCPVCGYNKMDEPPYDDAGNPSYDICSCCGFEFGVDDDIETKDGNFLPRKEAHIVYRNDWIEDGAKVFSPHAFESGLNEGDSLDKEILKQQLKLIHVNLEA